ncbi:hypothetical protein [Desulfobacca acetoxidans]
MVSSNLSRSGDNCPTPYYYRAFGLTIASALPCPELLPAEGAAEVTIRYGTVPDGLESVQRQGVCFQVNSEAFLLKLNTIAKYLVTAGKQIIIERAAGAQDNEVRLFLLGSAFAALLQQRGLLPLHGCAVEVNGGAAVFVGLSGCGKSTLAEALHQRGYRIMADDVCVISFASSGTPLVISAYPQLKLWADALKKLGRDPRGLPLVRAGLEKYGLPLKDGFSGNPSPLQRVYELAESNSQELELIPLQGLDKLTVLMRHTYRPQFLAGTLGKKRHFEQCGQAAQHCRVSRLVRPRTPFRLTELADLVEEDWA